MEQITDQALVDIIIDDLEPIPDYGDVMSATEWKEAHDSGWLIRSDGSGYWATQHGMSRYDCFKTNPEPHRFTHVIWFNK